MQHDLLSLDIVSQPVVSPAYPPLASLGPETGQLLDLMSPASVVGVFGEDGRQLLQSPRQSLISSRYFPELPLERKRRQD